MSRKPRKPRAPRLPPEALLTPPALPACAPPSSPADVSPLSTATDELLLHGDVPRSMRKARDYEAYRRAYRTLDRRSTNSLIRKGLGVGNMTSNQWLVWLRGQPAKEARRTLVKLLKTADVGTQRYLATWVLDRAYPADAAPEGVSTLIIQQIRAQVINLLPASAVRRAALARAAREAAESPDESADEPLDDAGEDTDAT